MINWPSGSGEEDENVKSLQTEGYTDGRTKGDQKSSLKFSAQVRLKTNADRVSCLAFNLSSTWIYFSYHFLWFICLVFDLLDLREQFLYCFLGFFQSQSTILPCICLPTYHWSYLIIQFPVSTIIHESMSKKNVEFSHTHSYRILHKKSSHLLLG